MRIADLVPATLMAGVLAWSYAPSLTELVRTWNRDPNYSHGFFVVPIALGILWQRWDRLDRSRLAPSRWGWAVLVAILVGRVWLYEKNEMWAESATLPILVAGLTLAFGGWRLLLWAAPSIAFLFFMLPLPPSLNQFLAYPLQRLATQGSTWLLQGVGLPALAEGNVIYIGTNQLEVEKACNGLSMLVTFVTLIAATTILVERSPWDKVVLLLSAVPIALVSNILRIAITAWSYHQFGPDAVVFPGWTVKRLTHDPAGWAMMPIALALVWLELRLLSWLIVEEDAEDRPAAPILRQYATALPIPTTPPAKR